MTRPFKARRHAMALACGALALQALAQTPSADGPAPAPAEATQRIEVQGQRVRNAAGRQTLTRDELERIPGSAGDPMRAVQTLPGVAAIDDSSSEPAVRGARPGDNVYYVDFLPVGYLFHLGGFASVFNPELIRRFDLASAAWSPEYGDVVGAVFDISLRSPRSDRLGGKLDLSLLGASVLAEGPLGDRLSFFVAGRRSWFDLLARTGEDKEEGVSYTVPVYHDTQARLLWNLNADHRLRLDFSSAGDRIDFTVKPDAKAGQREPVLVGQSTQRQAYRTYAATWEAEPGPRASNVLALGQMVNTESARVGSAGSLRLQTTTSYLRQQLQWRPTTRWSLALGGSLNSRLIDLDLDVKDPRCTEFDPACDLTGAPRVVSRQQTRRNLGDVYANQRWQISPDWTLTGGLRLGRDDALKKNYAEPRLGVEWNAASATQVSLGWGRHNQPPPPEESLRDIGNPRLEHLRSTHTVLGLDQQLGAGWSWRVEAYAKTFDRYAIADPLLNYRNGASGTARGVELLVKKEGSGRLSGFASVSLSRARRRNDATGAEFPFDFDQPVIVSLVGQYKLSERWQFGAKWSYHTGSPYTPVVGTGSYPDGRVRPLYGGVNAERVPAYHRLDLRVDARFSPTWTAYGELINAYARKNVAGYSYSADFTQREAVYQLPVLISFGVQYGF